MYGIRKAVALSTFTLILASGAAMAQEHGHPGPGGPPHPGYVRHDEWRRGYHMQQADWARAQRVADWRAAHLNAPPRGYEWRSVDGYYVLASPAGVVQTTVVIP